MNNWVIRYRPKGLKGPKKFRIVPYCSLLFLIVPYCTLLIVNCSLILLLLPSLNIVKQEYPHVQML